MRRENNKWWIKYIYRTAHYWLKLFTVYGFRATITISFYPFVFCRHCVPYRTGTSNMFSLCISHALSNSSLKYSTCKGLQNARTHRCVLTVGWIFIQMDIEMVSMYVEMDGWRCLNSTYHKIIVIFGCGRLILLLICRYVMLKGHCI